MQKDGSDGTGQGAVERVEVLIVDDVPDDVSHLARMLGAHFRVRVVSDGATALWRVRTVRPALILLDVGMPRVDGFALCRQLKADAQTAAIPVIFLTAFTAVGYRLEGFRAGCVDYITKPFYPEEVVARVHAHVQPAESLAEESEAEIGASADPALRAAVRYIREHLHELPTMAHIAQRVGLSEKQLLTRFRKDLGCTVARFVAEYRLRRAAELLRATAAPIEQIALEVGFSGAASFSTAFKDRLGASPSEYRGSARR